ncbi:MAG TPA: DNA-processing protein DprA [Fusibacter sp.]|nr:DNA-processing protein DprA [Fusibacter sp.]
MENNTTCILPDSPYYPETLQHYKPIVKMLFAKGDSALLTTYRKVSIVGSRKPTAYGRKVAYDLGRYLARNGVCVVSGMAIGIDSQAHKGALDEGGKTIAVLASGVNYVYPPSNDKMYHAICATGGLILSEQMMDEPPRTYHFPLRNRIISALSEVVVIIEAGEKSGSLITAMHAMEQGKTIYALPGSIYSPQSTGTNRLIYEGASPLIHFGHILESLGLSQENESRENAILDHLSILAQKIYALLLIQKKLDTDAIYEATMKEYSEICAAISELILDDLCEYSRLNEIRLV